jgi:hypothetical protein
MGIQCPAGGWADLYGLHYWLRNLLGGAMNPDRIDGNEKIKQILINYLRVWELMDRDELISQLIEEKRFFLETELEYGNEEYLDELLAEDA